MLDKDTVKDLVKTIFITKGYITEDSKSYSHKPHLASLPYDRRSTNFDELSERYTACMEKYYEHQKEVKRLTEVLNTEIDDFEKSKKDLDESLDKLNQWNEDNQKFFEADEPVLKEKRQWMNSIIERMNFDVSLPEKIQEELMGLDNYYFNDNYPISYLNEAEQNEFNDLAGRIVDFAYEQTGGDDTEWSNRVIGIADDLRVLARNDYFDKNLPSLHYNAHNIGAMSGLQHHINIM